ncbi:MAG: four helix bundle protein [Ardenticatenia bacterium]|nr:four helix bundle protein [Ardenticatenia bacterium]
MRRSGASIGAKIAAGCERGGDAEFARYLQIAMGSASELKARQLLVNDLGLLTVSDCEQLIQDVVEAKKMLASLIRTPKANR